MKKFTEFLLIVEGRSREEAQKALQSKSNPGDWELVNAGNSESPSWRVRLRSNRSVEGSRSAPTVAGKSKESKEQKARAIARKTQSKQEPEKKKAEPKKPEQKLTLPGEPHRPEPKKPVAKNNDVQWQSYTPISINWNLTGKESKVYTTNKNIVELYEMRTNIFGFTNYFKKQFSQYHLANKK